MKTIIVYSQQDPAGQTITQNLPKNGQEKFEIRQKLLHADKKTLPKADYYVFASKHSSEKQTQSLTVHATGNWGEALFGGEPKTLGKTSARLAKQILSEIREPPQGYQSSMEVTHHGPTNIPTPLIFAEIGSGPKQWGDKKAAEFLAKAISKAIKDFQKNKEPAAVGIGGPHYAPRFSQKCFQHDFAISHICPKHAIQHLDENMFKQMIQKTCEKVEILAVDWGGTPSIGKQKAKKFADQHKLELLKI